MACTTIFFALYMFKTYERCDFASELLKMQADKNTGEVSIYTIISNNQNEQQQWEKNSCNFTFIYKC